MATANDLINRCRDLIQDVEGQRWTDTELLRWLNDAQLEVVRIAPHANSALLTQPLSVGTSQPIPGTAIALIRFVGNGSTTNLGKVPMTVDVNQMDRADPNWRTATPTTVVEHVMTDPKHNIFHVYPPNNGAGSMVLECGVYPTVVMTTSGTISVEEEFSTSLVNYMAYRALQKDSDDVTQQKAMNLYLKLFYESLGASVPATLGGG